MDTITDLLSRLVAIDSINPDLVSGAAGEGALAQFVARWLTDAGVTVAVEEAAPGRPNVIGVVRGTGGGRSLLLNAHLDTVGVAGMEAPHVPSVREGRMYGRGAYDMKSGLAAAMLAAAEIARQPLRGDLILAAVVDEEYASIGTDALVGRWHADAAIVTEPTALQVCVAHRGFVWADITTRGVAAHGSRPDLGVDAIAKLGRILVGVEDLSRRLLQLPPHPLLSTGSLHASLVTGGQERSSYPASCTLALERRTLPGETPTAVLAELQAVIDAASADDPALEARLELIMERPAFEIDTAAPIVQALRTCAAQILGTPPAFAGATWWMDSAILAAAGIPTVIFGPTGAGAHAEVEWVDLASVARCAEVLTATAQAFCA